MFYCVGNSKLGLKFIYFILYSTVGSQKVFIFHFVALLVKKLWSDITSDWIYTGTFLAHAAIVKLMAIPILATPVSRN